MMHGQTGIPSPSMGSARQDKSVESVYVDMFRLIWKITKEVSLQYQADFDELLSEANFAFLRTFGSFDPSRGKRTTYTGTVVKNALILAIKKLRKRQKMEVTGMEFPDVPLSEGPLDKAIDEILMEVETLSKDARHVLALAIDAPESLTASVEQKQGHGGVERNWCRGIRTYLREEEDWRIPRIDKTFKELSGVLE